MFPHVVEVDLASSAEDEMEVFAASTPELFCLDTKDELSKMMTSLDMELDVNLSPTNDFPSIS